MFEQRLKSSLIHKLNCFSRTENNLPVTLSNVKFILNKATISIALNYLCIGTQLNG